MIFSIVWSDDMEKAEVDECFHHLWRFRDEGNLGVWLITGSAYQHRCMEYSMFQIIAMVILVSSDGVYICVIHGNDVW